MVHRILSSCSDVVFMTSLKSRFNSLSCGFMRLHCTCVFGLWNFVGVLQAPPQFPESANVLGFSLCTAWPIPSVFQIFLLGSFFLHGMAASMCTFNFFPAFFFISSNYLSSGSIKFFPLSLPAFSSFGFSFAHSCFCRFCAAPLAEICPYFRPHMIWSCCRLNFCQSLPGPHISFWRFLFQQSKFCDTNPRI